MSRLHQDTLEQSTILLHFVFWVALSHFSLILFHSLMQDLSLSFPLSFIFPSTSICLFSDLVYGNLIYILLPQQHILLLSSLLSSPCCLVLLRLFQADSPTNQDKSLSWSSVLGSHPSLPGQWPASVTLLWELLLAVITSGIKALGLPDRWHGGGGGCIGLKGGKGGSFCAADRTMLELLLICLLLQESRFTVVSFVCPLKSPFH